jgi:thiol-disulfide isomerase/thioredoxin
MTYLLRLTFAAALVGVVGCGVEDDKATDNSTDTNGSLIGKPAPNFQGDFALNGRPVSLRDLRGKVVLLDFWAVWCGPCIASFPHMRDWHKTYHDQGLEIVGLTMYNYEFKRNIGFDQANGRPKAIESATRDTECDMLRQFAAHHRLNYRLLVLPRDEWQAAVRAYRVQGVPTVVLIDRRGLVQMVRFGSGQANAKALEEEMKKLLAQ